jgi:hypothetical protein
VGRLVEEEEEEEERVGWSGIVTSLPVMARWGLEWGSESLGNYNDHALKTEPLRGNIQCTSSITGSSFAV